MTVGIGAIYESTDNPGIVLAADRMVTVGQTTKIEYENTNSKLETIIDSGPLTAMAVGSGSLSLIDDVLRRLDDKLVEDQPSTIGDIVTQARDAYQEMERDSIDNQVLSTFDVSVSELSSGDVSFDPQFQDALLNDIANLRSKIRENVNILIGGSADDGPKLYTVSGGDYTSFTDTGYAVVGSGTQSAELTFIRNRYDTDAAGQTEALFSVAEAKIQAEERQGVGQKMDVIILDDNGINEVEEIQSLRDEMQRVEREQEEARQRVMDEWE